MKLKKNLFVLVVAVMLVMVGCGSKPTLAELLESDEVVAGQESAKKRLMLNWQRAVWGFA